MVTMQVDQFRRVGRALFMAAGVPEENALGVTESLLDSSLAGHDSHGVIRFVQYVEAIEAGHINPSGRPEIIKETPTSALVDCHWTFGQLGARLSMGTAIAKAKAQGIAITALIRAYHTGRQGEYAEMAHDAGMIGMVAMGGVLGAAGRPDGGVAPYGGAEVVFGTNPISFGLPAGIKAPVMVDYATSAIAGGKLSFARAKGEPLPPGSILDRLGRPSTNPEDYYAGGVMLPFGGHKGYALAVVSELLGRSLTGAEAHMNEGGGGPYYCQSGSVFIAIDPGLFWPADRYLGSADAVIGRIKAARPAAGFDEVLVPGEPEQRSKARRVAEGISLPENSWETLRKLAAKYGIDVESFR
jgi:uncharacterized oxidoreductase